mmetsp:Transcript_33970/g.105151  ORF Transcript_33970/g.105151 Transcript_33970/m.105151 type:complete len:204 (+) Transcript_33970:170-781(+)
MTRRAAIALLCGGAAALNPLGSALAKQLHPGRPASNVLTAGAIYAVADLAAQRVADPPGFDRPRFAGALCLGCVWMGLCIPPVYAAAEALAPGRSPGKVVKKMLFSCALLSTFGNWVTMFARRYLQVLRGVDESSSFRDCVASCNRDIWPVLRVDLKIWPLYDVLCFAVIAPDWRPVATTLMSCAWQAFMSAVSARTARREAE